MDLAQRTNSIFACLGHPYRRQTVTIVTEMNGSLTLDELAREIATRTDQPQSGGQDSEPVEAIRIQLYHRHLPKLAEANLIEYDRDSHLVSSTPITTHLTALVKIADSIAELM